MPADSAPLDAKVSALLEQQQSKIGPDDLDEDALFEALENEDNSAYRAHRMEQLHSELASAKEAFKRNAALGATATSSDGLYPTLPSDQVVLDLTTNNERCIVHFSHPDFNRCAIMDEHLRILASRHYEVRFARVDVRDCPFLVEKLGIRVLPCVIGFIDGIGKERIVGFDGLSSVRGRDGVDGFNTTELESRFLGGNVLVRGKLVEGGPGIHNRDSDSDDEEAKGRGIRSGTVGRHKNDDDDDNDDDWD
ncbi:thioredoxin-like protein [Talaromyces proteolyticus]|uniref:Thioredoxin-like protein n=1 Tax=Talaromyces proteolyticus TaxID=1131652 RepID=A0AAD4PZH2_9EURO|nr:thioredoxin-like protein [Talaromyces proteolyticus]KAH8702620.1 thioredoxin-like protein [Talaromyces proteolyticus]